jgi:hypothetical protein
LPGAFDFQAVQAKALNKGALQPLVGLPVDHMIL